MVNRVDGAILGVGALVLLASVLGVIFYEDGASTYTVSWAEDDGTQLPAASDEGGPQEYTFDVPVNGTAIARVSFMVEVSVGGVQLSEDTIQVTASAPNDPDESGSCQFTLAAGQGSTGSCTADATPISQPEGFTVTAANQTEAEAKAVDRIASGNGTGTWTVTVTIDGGQELQDPTYTVNLEPTLYEWEATAQLPTTGGEPGPG